MLSVSVAEEQAQEYLKSIQWDQDALEIGLGLSQILLSVSVAAEQAQEYLKSILVYLKSILVTWEL